MHYIAVLLLIKRFAVSLCWKCYCQRVDKMESKFPSPCQNCLSCIIIIFVARSDITDHSLNNVCIFLCAFYITS